MQDTKPRLLVVDDDTSVRMTLSCVLTEVGYRVRTAEDGFSALAELRKEVPEILLSDLNMPGMSGFELLSVVRRRFPSIQTIAMSSAFSGDEVPSGVAADAFHQKGSSVGSLLRMIETLPWHDRMSLEHVTGLAPLWIKSGGQDNEEGAHEAISCPECLRTFSNIRTGTSLHMREIVCVHCRSLIDFSIAQPAGSASLPSFQPSQARPLGTQVPNY